MTKKRARDFSAQDLVKGSKRRKVRKRGVRASTWPKFYENLSFMVKAGLPLTDALSQIEALNEDVGLSRHLRDVIQALESGVSLPDAFNRHLPNFPTLHREMLAIAVETGSLEKVLRHLADYEYANQRARLQLAKILTYPALQFSMAFLLISIAPAHFQDSLIETLSFMGRELPWPVSLFFHYSWFMNYVAVASLSLLFPLGFSGVRDRLASYWVEASTRAFLSRWKRKAYRLSVHIPGVGKAVRAYSQERFTRALAFQVEAGRGLVASLRAAFLVTGDPNFLDHTLSVVEEISNGEQLVDALARTELFDKVQFLSFLSAGEESGSLAELLMKSADLQAFELQGTLSRSMALLNPILLLGIGALVAALVLAVFLPMIQLTQSL